MIIPLLKEKGISARIEFKKQNNKFYPRLRVVKERKSYTKQYSYNYQSLSEDIKNEKWIKSITKNDILALIPAKKELNHNILYLSNLLADSKRRAKRDGLEFDITRQYLEWLYSKNSNCVLTNIPLSLNKGYMNSISIDRIDNNKGYIRGNIQLVCKSINHMKNIHTNEECKEFIKLINERRNTISV